MALHIRDFRQSDAAGLSRLSERARRIGVLPSHDTKHRILAGLRGDRLAGAVWLNLERKTGIIPAIVVTASPCWQSDMQELISEACLWLTSRGAASLELTSIPHDKDLLAGLLDMHFKAEESTGVMRRMVPVRSAA
jgi:hypothetical protein